MNRRKFLGMLGLAPVVGVLLKGVAPKLFWAGTTVPREMPLPLDAWTIVEDYERRAQAVSGYNEWNPADPIRYFRQVEIVELTPYPCPEGMVPHMEVVARGFIPKTKADAMGLLEAPDGVIRLSDLLWRHLPRERKEAIAVKFSAKILDKPEILIA